MNLANTEIAYRSKSTTDLKRGFFIFKLFQYPFLIALGKAMTSFFLFLNWPLPRLVRLYIYNQFCGGAKEADALALVAKLSAHGVDSCVHHAAENSVSEVGSEKALQEFLEVLQLGKKSNAFRFSVLKPTSIGVASIYEKVSVGQPLTPTETQQWNHVQNRFSICCKEALASNTKLLVDAEESWFQHAIDQLLEAAMLTHNQGEAKIFTTVQMYRKDRMAYLKHLLNLAQKNNIIVGVKLVRGAYLVKETAYAQAKGIPSALCDSKQATDANFEEALTFMLSNLSHFALFFGSHNEKNVQQVVSFMQAHQIAPDHPHIFFSQLYGMCDHITFNLAHSGYKAVKYIPYGELGEVIPYLMRRVEENTAVMSQSIRELDLYRKEIERRQSNATL